jgi:hypothetical protein
MYARFGVPHADATHCSVEEISSRILQLTGCDEASATLMCAVPDQGSQRGAPNRRQ